MRRATAYSSSCSHVALVLVIYLPSSQSAADSELENRGDGRVGVESGEGALPRSQFTLKVCAAAESRKNIKTPVF